MDTSIVIPVIVAFVISVVLAPLIIPFLRRLKVGQTEREDGVQSHLKKAGTPTMGGLIFLIATTVTSLFFCREQSGYYSCAVFDSCFRPDRFS